MSIAERVIPLSSNAPDLECVQIAIKSFVNDNELPNDLAGELQVIADEVLSNTLKYGRGTNDCVNIRVRIQLNRDEVKIVFEDDGQPFDPLGVDVLDFDQPMENRPIGGLGLTLVRALADGIDYKRTNSHNILVITKSLGE